MGFSNTYTKTEHACNHFCGETQIPKISFKESFSVLHHLWWKLKILHAKYKQLIWSVTKLCKVIIVVYINVSVILLIQNNHSISFIEPISRFKMHWNKSKTILNLYMEYSLAEHMKTILNYCFSPFRSVICVMNFLSPILHGCSSEIFSLEQQKWHGHVVSLWECYGEIFSYGTLVLMRVKIHRANLSTLSFSNSSKHFQAWVYSETA